MKVLCHNYITTCNKPLNCHDQRQEISRIERGYERVYLPLYKVADTPFYIQGESHIINTYDKFCQIQTTGHIRDYRVIHTSRVWRVLNWLLAHVMIYVNPYNTELFLFKTWETNGVFHFEMIINVSVSSFRLIWILMVSNPAWCRIFREISCFSPLNLGTLLRWCVLGQDTSPSNASLDSG